MITRFRFCHPILLVLSGILGGSIESSAQSVSPDEPDEVVPLEDDRLQLPPPVEVIAISEVEAEPGSCESCEEVTVAEPEEPTVEFGDWVGYHSTQSKTTWLSGGDFGMFSLESLPALDIGNQHALLIGTGFHFLEGPKTPDLPPRLFDFQLAYQTRKPLSQSAMLDVRVGVGAFSDFQGSARDGVRFPGHVVTYFDHRPDLATVWGVEVLDRDDITLLPVAGTVWRPHKDLVLECVFPRPSVQLRIDQDHAFFFGGELGGGTWAVERSGAGGEVFMDNVTYSDLRVTCGIMDFGNDSDSVLEIGWAFDRSLRFRSTVGDQDLDGAFVLRFHTHY